MQENTKSVVVKMTARRCFRTEPIWQYDGGHVLTFEGFDLPMSFEVHFSRSPVGNAIPQIGTNGVCTVPEMFTQNAGVIYAWLYIADVDSRLTKYSIEIPVAKRAKPTNQEPTPVEQSAIDQAIAALNAGVEAAEDAQEAAEAAQTSAESYAESAGQSAITATNAATSAGTSAGNAAASATSAGTSATDANASRQAADLSATNAGISERNAAASATAAAGSATSAAASASQASASATAASGSASTASTKAGEAAQSATAAAGSAASASENAGTASTAATAAEASATAAAGSATAAAGSATSAGQSATAAAGSAAAAQEVLESIPEDYTELTEDVDSLKSAINGLEPLNPNGINIDLSGVTNGNWTNANVGDIVTPATNNNARRIVVDLSNYVGWEVTIKLVSSINPAAYLGLSNYLCDSTGTINVKILEKEFLGTGYTYTVTEETAYMYLSYTYIRSSVVVFESISASAMSDTGKDIASIPDLREQINKAVVPLSFTNICENSDIDDTTGFSVNSSGSIIAVDNVLEITQTYRNIEVHYSIPTLPIVGHKYYCAADLKSNYTGSGLFMNLLALKSGVSTNKFLSQKYNGNNPDAWQRLSSVGEFPETHSGGTLKFEIYCNQQSDFVMKYLRRIVIVDLTAIFGAGNEPNAGTFEEIVSGANDGSAFFKETLSTNVIIATPYPNDANNKPIYVGISGYVMNVNAKYNATKDIRYKIGKAGSNSLFNWRGFDFIDNTNQIVSPSVDLSQNITVITDWFGPHKLKATNNIDGDMPDSDNFTGGNHAYNGDSSGTPTARTASYAFYVDGRKVDAFLGYAYYVDVYWENRVQATNTKKSDGTGREVLKETFHMHFDGEKWTLDGMLEPLEAISSWSYYGIQMSRGSSYNGYIFYHDSPDNRTWHSTGSSSNSGTNACRTITMHDGSDYFEMHIGPDGLGDFALIGNENSFFSTDSKTYSNLVKGATDVAANSVYTYDGYYKWYNMDLPA